MRHWGAKRLRQDRRPIRHTARLAMDAKAQRLRRRPREREITSARRLHPHPREIAGLRPDWARPVNHCAVGMAGWAGKIRPARRDARDRPPEGRNPVILIESPGDALLWGRHCLLYGHLDKQPEMTGWSGPWARAGDPRRQALAAAAPTTAMRSMPGDRSWPCRPRASSVPRCVVLIEPAESALRLPFYVDHGGAHRLALPGNLPGLRLRNYDHVADDIPAGRPAAS